MPKQLNLQIVTPAEQKFEGMADMTIMRAVGGEIGILPNHENCNIALDAGVLRIKMGDEMKNMQISGGIATIENNNLVIMTNEATWLE